MKPSFACGAVLWLTVYTASARPDSGITFCGFVKTDLMYDTLQTVALREGYFLLYPAPAAYDIAWRIGGFHCSLQDQTMADDELVLGHRNSEWAGHAPILEEDIAFSNIARDELGHALVWYTLHEQLGGKTPDFMGFERSRLDFTCYRFDSRLSLRARSLRFVLSPAR